LRNWRPLLLFLSGIILGCLSDAPHDNPLDPASPHFDPTGQINGTVVHLNAPTAPIPSALITVDSTGTSVLSNAAGQFSIPSVPSRTVSLIVSKQGYLIDTIQINVVAGQTYNVESSLDALPQISNASVITRKIDQWWPGPVYNAFISATITDPDGQTDLTDSVYCHVDTLAFPMAYSPTGQTWELTITSDQLPSENLQWLVGKPFVIDAFDKSEGEGSSVDFYVSRIIESEATPTSPAPPADTVEDTLQFEWDPPSPSDILFTHTYVINVVQVVADVQTLIWSSSTISSEPPFSYIYPGTLQQGNYFWTITIVDEYGNSSQSKEATFTVP
jgi:Carboxypeptidase regulatory-like domain